MKLLRFLVVAAAGVAGCAHKPLPPPPPPPRALALAADRPFDGLYSGVAVLLSGKGSCNAGGTAQVTIVDNVVRYRDPGNGPLTGRIEPNGVADLRSGDLRLVGLVEGDLFTARVLGGPCEFKFMFHRVHAVVPSGGGR